MVRHRVAIGTSLAKFSKGSSLANPGCRSDSASLACGGREGCAGTNTMFADSLFADSLFADSLFADFLFANFLRVSLDVAGY